jgi:hypothetical protein
MRRNDRKSGGFTVKETMMLGVLLIGGILAIVFVLFIVLAVIPVRYPRRPHYDVNTCINNLRIIDGAKGQWAMEHHKENTDTPAASDIQPYMGHGPTIEMPSCPNDPRHTFATSYSINNVGSVPICKIYPTNHILP